MLGGHTEKCGILGGGPSPDGVWLSSQNPEVCFWRGVTKPGMCVAGPNLLGMLLASVLWTFVTDVLWREKSPGRKTGSSEELSPQKPEKERFGGLRDK